MEAMEVMEFMASVRLRLSLRPRLRPSPTPLDRLLMASPLPMPMLPGTLTMLDIPASSPLAMAMEAMEAMELMESTASVRLRPMPTTVLSPPCLLVATPRWLAPSTMATESESMASVRLRPRLSLGPTQSDRLLMASPLLT